MRTRTGLLSIAGVLGVLAPAAAAASFDGTYQLVSSSKITQSFVDRGGNMGFCPDRRPGPFTVTQGEAQYTTESGRNLQASVNPNGAFEMRSADVGGAIQAQGTIDGNGTVHVRQIGNSCSYDFVWRRQS